MNKFYTNFNISSQNSVFNLQNRQLHASNFVANAKSTNLINKPQSGPHSNIFNFKFTLIILSIILLALFILFKFNIEASVVYFANYYKLSSLVISFVVSYFITSVLLHLIKYSTLRIFLHKLIIAYIIIIVALLFYNYFHIIPEAYCDGTDNDISSNEQQPQPAASGNIYNDKNTIEKASLKNEQTKEDKVCNLSVSINDSDIDYLTRSGKTFMVPILPNDEASAACGSTAGSMIKATGYIPPLHRSLMIGSAAFATVTATTIGLRTGIAIAKNINKDVFNSSDTNPNVESTTINPASTSPASPTITPNSSSPTSPTSPTNTSSPISTTSLNPTTPPSPTSPTSPPSPDGNMINSPLEANENISPLDTLLENILVLNILELFLFALVLLILCNRYFYKFNIEYTTKLVNKYMPNTVIRWYTNNIPRSIDYNNKFTTIMFILVSVLLILIKLGNIYISAELSINTESYVRVYNYLKSINK